LSDREPGNFWLNSYLARSLKLLGRSEEAVRYFTAAQAVLPVAAHELAHALEDKGETDGAIGVFRDLSRRRPHEARHYTCLGKALKSRGRGREADDAFDAAIVASRRRVHLKPDSVQAHFDLGCALESRGNTDEAIAEYREAVRLNPDYAVAHNNLGVALRAQGKTEQAIEQYRQAIRLQSDYAEAHNNLGLALKAKGEIEAAIAEFREAIRLKPDLAEPHCNLGNALRAQGKVDLGIEQFREAIRLRPDLAEAHCDLGSALDGKGAVEAAIAEFREAIRLNPDDALAYYNLGNALKARGENDAAIAEYRRAIRLKPDLAEAHNNLGAALGAQGKTDQAIDEFREAIRLKPDNAGAHGNLGRTLLSKGDVDGSIAALHRARDLASSNPDLLRKVENLLADAERARRLPAVLRGDDRPADVDEELAFAKMCLGKKLDAAAARLFADALSANPALADDRRAQHPYNAACAAALAGCGQGQDDPAPDEAARAKLRQQALDWLKGELAAWTRVLDRDAKAAEAVAQTMRHWKADPDLIGVRDADGLAKLPEAERTSWRALWDEVDSLLTKVGSR
jgi:tetratricopeptide (TPR) repeat protein